MVRRRASTRWEGGADGAGTVELDSSGALPGMTTSAGTRVVDPNGQAGPEELLAAAISNSCAMSLAKTSDLPITVTAVVELDTKQSLRLMSVSVIVESALDPDAARRIVRSDPLVIALALDTSVEARQSGTPRKSQTS